MCVYFGLDCEQKKRLFLYCSLSNLNICREKDWCLPCHAFGATLANLLPPKQKMGGNSVALVWRKGSEILPFCCHYTLLGKSWLVY